MIPYGCQQISDDDVRAVETVLRSNYLTQGPTIPAFEGALSKKCRVEHAVAVSSATAALHIACLALDVGPGDRVWSSPNTFVASANCARYCGARIDFVDIDPKTLNLCPERLSEKLRHAAQRHELPKVVIPVHFAGQPCDMAAIRELSRRYEFQIIEDASHAVGASYGQTVTGDCHYSEITVFSFHPVKIITTAEGGVATTQSSSLAQKMRLLRSHGITRDTTEMTRPDEGPWYYEQRTLGFNYRMTDIQAALGLSQLKNLSAWIDRRHQIADRYDAELRQLPVSLPIRPSGSRSALHLYWIHVANRRIVFDRLRAAGIGVNVHYYPVHLQPDFRQFGFEVGMFPESEKHYQRTISLPIFASLDDTAQTTVIEAIKRALR